MRDELLVVAPRSLEGSRFCFLSLLFETAQMTGGKGDVAGDRLPALGPCVGVKAVDRHGLRLAAVSPDLAKILHRNEDRCAVAILEPGCVLDKPINLQVLQVSQDADPVILVN